jgi:hypothetical protein
MRGGRGWTMRGKGVANKATRGIKMGQWTTRGCLVEVAGLQPVSQCNRETLRQHNNATDARGRQRDNAVDRMPQQCDLQDDVMIWTTGRCGCCNHAADGRTLLTAQRHQRDDAATRTMVTTTAMATAMAMVTATAMTTMTTALATARARARANVMGMVTATVIVTKTAMVMGTAMALAMATVMGWR